MAGLIGKKRSQARAGAGTVELALDLTPEAVILFERAASGGWKKFAAAPLDDPEFKTVIALLRAEAEARAGGPLPVCLWLPADQVLHLRTQIKTPDGSVGETARLRAAFDAVARETEFRPEDVAVAVAPAGRGGQSTVLVTFAQTWREARTHAQRWGFQPGIVSTRHRASDFGAEGPVFRPREALDQPVPARRSKALLLAAAGAAIAVAAAVLLAVLPGTPPPDQPASGVSRPATEPSPVAPAPPDDRAATRDSAPDARATEAAPEPGVVSPPAAEATVAAGPAAPPAPETFAFAVAPAPAGTPPAVPVPQPAKVRLLAPAQPAAPPALATVPTPPPNAEASEAPRQTGTLPEPSLSVQLAAMHAAEARHPVAAPPGFALLGTQPALAPVTASVPDRDALGLPRSDDHAFTPPAAPRAPGPVSKLTALGSGILPEYPPPELPLQPEGAAPPPPDPEITPASLARQTDALPAPPAPPPADPDSSPGAEAEPDFGSAALADALPTWVPRPRPSIKDEPEAATAIFLPRPRPSGPDAPAPSPSESGLEAPADAPEPSREPAGNPASAPLPVPIPTARPATALAALDPVPDVAPDAASDPTALPIPVVPQARPELAPTGPEAKPETDPAVEDAPTELAALSAPLPLPRPKRTLALPSASALPKLDSRIPRSVRTAATEQGLPLDRTALIGILNLDGNRKALLRLPNGRYRSVVVGDVLDGWKVSAIGVDAMRVSRGGEDVTLILVSR